MTGTRSDVMQVRPTDTSDDGVPDGDFAAFYRRELDGQVRRASMLLGSNEAGNDVVHDAFTRMYERWDRIDDPGPYLNRAVLNACRDIGRRRVVAADADLRLRASATPEPDDVMFDVLDHLPFNQRAAVILRYYGRWTENEIAEALDCRPGSIGPWIRSALDSMRKELS